jgi:hypothetical protein
MSEAPYYVKELVELKYIEPIKSGKVWNIFEKHRGKRVFNVPNDLAFCVENPDLVLKSDHDQKVKLLEAALEKCREQRNKEIQEQVFAFSPDGDYEYIRQRDAELDLILTPKPSEG